MEIRGKGAEEVFHKVLEALNKNGIESAPRGLKIKELVNCCITIDNPRDRIISCPERGFSSAYAFGELAWYLSGRNDLGMMSYYSKFMERGTDDGITLNSAYGYRIFSAKHPLIPFNQWDNVKRVLADDRDSRQAIIHLHTPNNKKTNDEVCTIALQFLIRNGKLDMITTMRSNDIVLGFTYDVFSFTMLQEILANELGVKLGTYYHNAGSMHIYENKFDLLTNATVSMLPAMQPFDFGLTGFNQMLGVEDTMRMAATVNAKVSDDFCIRKTDSDLIFFAESAYAMKFLDVSENVSQALKVKCQNNICNDVRKCNETYADILALQSKQFTHGGKKVIVEGVDGSGKTSYINKMMQDDDEWESKETIWNIQHYGKPTESFGYFSNYLYNMLSSTDTIFDRFFPSEIVYSLIRGDSRLSMNKLKKLLEFIDEKNTKFVFMIAKDKEQMKTIQNRLSREDEDKKSYDAIQNAAYKMFAEYLQEQGFRVEIRNIEPECKKETF